MSHKTITFECSTILAEALHEMAEKAASVRDSYDGTSATHWLAWDALASAITEAAGRREELLTDTERRALLRGIPTRRKNWQGPWTLTEAQARADLDRLDEGTVAEVTGYLRDNPDAILVGVG